MISPKRFAAIFARDGGRCQLDLPGCTIVGTCPDHRANRGSGGSKVLDDPAVLVLACASCNSAKADGDFAVLRELEARGLYIRKAATNQRTLDRARQTPVTDPLGRKWLLISDTERVAA